MKNTNTHIPQPSDIDSTTQFEYTNKVESASANEAASDGFKLKSCFGLKYWKDEATGLKRGSFYTGSWFPFFKTSVSWAILPKNRKWEERVVTERARGLVSFSETQSQLEDTDDGDGNALFLENTEVRWGKTVRYYLFKEMPIVDIRYIFGRLSFWVKPAPTRKQTEYLMTLQQQYADQQNSQTPTPIPSTSNAPTAASTPIPIYTESSNDGANK